MLSDLVKIYVLCCFSREDKAEQVEWVRSGLGLEICAWGRGEEEEAERQTTGIKPGTAHLEVATVLLALLL